MNGLLATGYSVGEHAHPRKREDLLVIWNRQSHDETLADDWEQRGGTVVVCENGYFGRDATGNQLYAIAVHGHNGSGWFHVGEEDRFTPLGIELRPWRVDGSGHVLVCGQRGIGSARMASPKRWEIDSAKRLRLMGFKDVRIRQHPGRAPAKTTLDQDLEGARACVIWSSSSGFRALQLGIPVVFGAPHWVGAAGASKGLGGVERLVMNDESRLRAMHVASWGQRTLAEIETGEPFRTILERLEEVKWA